MLRTLYEKIWDEHVVDRFSDGTYLLYVDRHLAHEVDSPQAFAHLRKAGLRVRSPEKTLLVVDHNVSTLDRSRGDARGAQQMAYLAENAQFFGLEIFDQDDPRQGISHVVAPEQGFVLPGTVVVCGDSHTTTHGAFGALAFGIGTSDAAHVFATQTVVRRKSKTMRIKLDGALPQGVTAKDLILWLIRQIGAAGAVGFAIEFAGAAIEFLTMEARMTVCNMAVEAGAAAAMIAPDFKTFAYIEGRPKAPSGPIWNRALTYWETLRSDDDAEFDLDLRFDVSELRPQVTWGTSPEQVTEVSGRVPLLASHSDLKARDAAKRALDYMGFAGGERLADVKIDTVFIGSCTNGRIEDLRDAARLLVGRTISPRVTGLVVPGSGPVRLQAEAEGLADAFIAAGFEWRLPGCSMCLGMNGDILLPMQRCVSTSSRNFEHRQGYRGRTHLGSPATAAASAIAGHIVDPHLF